MFLEPLTLLVLALADTHSLPVHIKTVREDIEKNGAMANSPYVNRAQVSQFFLLVLRTRRTLQYESSSVLHTNPSTTQPFHTDLCDVLGMYALGVAASGGESSLASTAKIYNELARNRPDIIELLAKDDWVFDE